MRIRGFACLVSKQQHRLLAAAIAPHLSEVGLEKFDFPRKSKFFRTLLFCVLFSILNFSSAHASSLSGAVAEDNFVDGKSKVVDGSTGAPVSDAVVSIPAKGLSVITDQGGNFKMDAGINKPMILSVQKEGYKPFSLTVNENTFSKPFAIEIVKQAVNEITIDSDLRHLGDNNFSSNSANASDFKLSSVGPEFTKSFNVGAVNTGQAASIVIGSVIGLDTEMARRLSQNKIMFAKSSPAEIFVNSQKVGELKVNGDNQKIEFSPRLLKANSKNQIKIKTGINLDQQSYVDYDDIELMNVFAEVK